MTPLDCPTPKIGGR